MYYSPEEIERAFYNASQNQQLSYVKFILLWASFNSRIARDSNELYDRNMISWVKRGDSRFRRRYDCMKQNDAEFRNLILRLRPTRVINFMEFKYRARALRDGKPRRDKPTHKQIRRTNEFASVIDVIYLVRCNLVHGSKNIEEPMEQELVELCYNILLKLYEDDII